MKRHAIASSAGWLIALSFVLLRPQLSTLFGASVVATVVEVVVLLAVVSLLTLLAIRMIDLLSD